VGGEKPDQQWDAGDAAHRDGVGQIHAVLRQFHSVTVRSARLQAQRGSVRDEVRVCAIEDAATGRVFILGRYPIEPTRAAREGPAECEGRTRDC